MAFRSSTSSNGAVGFNEPTCTVTKPAGVVDGDFLVIFFAIESAGSSVTTLSGWTAHPSNPLTVSADGQRGFLFYKIASSEPASWDWTWSNGGSSGANYHCLAFSGRNTSSPLSDSNTGSSNTPSASPLTITANAVTALDGDDLAIFMFLDNLSAATMSYTQPSAFTEATDVSDNNFTSSATAYKENVSAGSTGSISGTGTYSAGSAGFGAFLLAIAAAGGGGAAGSPVLPRRNYGRDMMM